MKSRYILKVSRICLGWAVWLRDSEWTCWTWRWFWWTVPWRCNHALYQ